MSDGDGKPCVRASPEDAENISTIHNPNQRKMDCRCHDGQDMLDGRRSSSHTKKAISYVTQLLMCSVIFLLLLILLFGTLTNAIPIDSQTTFGHSIKNGPLPAKEEVTAFEHQCQIPP